MERSNRLIAALAVACFIGAFSLTPSEVRSRLTGAPPELLAPPVSTPSPAVVADVPAGDPFAARAVDDTAPPAPSARSLVIAPVVPPVGRAALIPSAPVAHVSAVAIGAQAEAIVVDGGRTRLVTLGDALEGSLVSAIDEGGLTLADGRRLSLAPAARP